MLITSKYDSEGRKQIYHEFVCELSEDTELVFTFDFVDGVARKCKLETRNKSTDVVQEIGTLDYEDSKDLVRVMNTVSVQLQEMENTIPMTPLEPSTPAE